MAADELPSGENIISLRNLDTIYHTGKTDDPNKYIGFDYFQMIPSRPAAGSFLIIR